MRPTIKVLILCAAAMWGGAAAAGAAEIILYGRTNFEGPSVTLTQSAPDLRDQNFDNDLESFRVISGTWRIHRDANYQDNSGPSLTVGPGSYPDIQELERPRNRMSSVRLGEIVAANCRAPYQVPNPDGVACTFTCGSGTVPDRASGQCVCQRGWVRVGADNQGRRICRPRQIEQPPPDEPVVLAPTPPLLQALWVDTTAFDIDERARVTLDREVALGASVATSDQLAGAALMYRAIEGPRVIGNAAMLQLLANAPWLPYRDQYARQPRPIAFQISADAGVKYVYFQVRARTVGASGGAAWIASAPTTDTILHEPSVAEAPQGGGQPQRQEYVVDGLFAFDRAQANGFRFSVIDIGNWNSDCILAGPVATAKYGPTTGVSALIEAGCIWTVFNGRDLADGWRMVEMQFLGSGVSNQTYADPAGLDLPMGIDFSAGRPFKSVTMTLRSITLEGPAGRNWQEAFACRGRCPD